VLPAWNVYGMQETAPPAGVVEFQQHVSVHLLLWPAWQRYLQRPLPELRGVLEAS
jgi:hypothetical protein